MISSKTECAHKCLTYTMCQTATYYEQIQICSLYSEKYSVGQILGGINQASSVLEMKNREPTIRVLSSQSTWSQSAITLAGNSAGISGSGGSHLYIPIPFYYDQPNNLIIVGDNGNSRVIQFHLNNPSSNGTVIAGGNGNSCTSLNQFYNTVGIALDSSRHLYVSDSGCSRILMFPPNSNSSTFGVLIITLSIPEGIFINSLTDDLYVAVYSTSSVVMIAKNSTVSVVVAGGNGGGNGLNQLYHSNSVYFDYLYTNSLYVTDTDNNRVLKFPSGSTSLTNGTIVAGSSSSGSGSNQLSNPRASLVDMNGIVYVSDGGNNRIQRWLPGASSGDTLVGGVSGTASNQLTFTESILFNENYQLLVVDRGNNRIQIFNITAY
ncbi:unnamed protein product [Adineta steineri]|uniref:Apple domain-containing protein n=1 Tax=Adineta steineri TaxID=433720 RepID=A0A814BN33_9BILA|nr:unnamed protein product [Adineta steineri]